MAEGFLLVRPHTPCLWVAAVFLIYLVLGCEHVEIRGMNTCRRGGLPVTKRGSRGLEKVLRRMGHLTLEVTAEADRLFYILEPQHLHQPYRAL